MKNRSDKDTLPDIADTAADFVSKWRHEMNGIVPVPPSRRRAFQPVAEIGRALADRLAIPVLEAAVTKTKETPQLKDVSATMNARSFSMARFPSIGSSSKAPAAPR